MNDGDSAPTSNQLEVEKTENAACSKNRSRAVPDLALQDCLRRACVLASGWLPGSASNASAIAECAAKLRQTYAGGASDSDGLAHVLAEMQALFLDPSEMDEMQDTVFFAFNELCHQMVCYCNQNQRRHFLRVSWSFLKAIAPSVSQQKCQTYGELMLRSHIWMAASVGTDEPNLEKALQNERAWRMKVAKCAAGFQKNQVTAKQPVSASTTSRHAFKRVIDQLAMPPPAHIPSKKRKTGVARSAARGDGPAVSMKVVMPSLSPRRTAVRAELLAALQGCIVNSVCIPEGTDVDYVDRLATDIEYEVWQIWEKGGCHPRGGEGYENQMAMLVTHLKDAMNSDFSLRVLSRHVVPKMLAIMSEHDMKSENLRRQLR